MFSDFLMKSKKSKTVKTKKTDFNKFFELFQSRKLVSDIFAIVEDTRVENCIKNKLIQ